MRSGCAHAFPVLPCPQGGEKSAVAHDEQAVARLCACLLIHLRLRWFAAECLVWLWLPRLKAPYLGCAPPLRQGLIPCGVPPLRQDLIPRPILPLAPFHARNRCKQALTHAHPDMPP
eukprot:365901-Chlamydomonas_euryale.AAC.5